MRRDPSFWAHGLKPESLAWRAALCPRSCGLPRLTFLPPQLQCPQTCSTAKGSHSVPQACPSSPGSLLHGRGSSPGRFHLRPSFLVSEELSPSGGPRGPSGGGAALEHRVLTLCHPGLSSQGLRAPRPPCVPSAFGLPACCSLPGAPFPEPSWVLSQVPSHCHRGGEGPTAVGHVPGSTPAGSSRGWGCALRHRLSKCMGVGKESGGGGLLISGALIAPPLSRACLCLCPGEGGGSLFPGCGPCPASCICRHPLFSGWHAWRGHGAPAGARVITTPALCALSDSGRWGSIPSRQTPCSSGGHLAPSRSSSYGPRAAGSGIRRWSGGPAPTCGPPNPAHRRPREALQLGPSEQPCLRFLPPVARGRGGDPAPLRSAPLSGTTVLPALHLPSMAVYTCTG